MKEMRPITYEDSGLTPPKNMFEEQFVHKLPNENEELRRLIELLRNEVNALRNEVKGLSDEIGRITKRSMEND